MFIGVVMKLSIIVVNYNTFELTRNTLRSVFEKRYPWEYEIILVDNASKDNSIASLAECFQKEVEEGKLHIIINDDNLGFSKANNIGIRASMGQYVLLLNSDTKVIGDCLEVCVKQMEEDSSIGALGCRVVLTDGQLDHACKRGFPTPRASLYYFLKLHKKNSEKYGRYNASHLLEHEVGEVDSLTGAFMMMDRGVLEKVGFLDEDFFMYGEDIDLCYRIKERGYRILYYPKAQIIHYKGGSSKKRRTKVIYDFHNAMWIFYRKHYRTKYPFYVTGIVYSGIWTKYFFELVKNLFKR